MEKESFQEHFHGPNEAQTCDLCRRGEFANRRADVRRLSTATGLTLAVAAVIGAVGVLAFVARAASRARNHR